MKILPITLLFILSATLANAAKDKEKDKATNTLPRVNTLLPQLLPQPQCQTASRGRPKAVGSVF